MPKLSSFVKRGKGPAPAAPAAEERQPVRTEREVAASAKGGKSLADEASFAPVAAAAKPAPRPDLGIPKQTLDEYNASKVFRWPDGSLRREKPPAKREVVLARKEWEDIVTYCRRSGGCPYCEKGYCLRHGFGVSAEDHRRYCEEIGVWNQSLQDLMEQLYMEDQGLTPGPVVAAATTT